MWEDDGMSSVHGPRDIMKESEQRTQVAKTGDRYSEDKKKILGKIVPINIVAHISGKFGKCVMDRE